MKKTLLFILAGLMALSMQGQIQRTFMGQTLGVSTKSEVLKSLEYKGAFEQIISGEQTVCIKDIRFGGHLWGMITFNFYNGKLMNVSLIDFNENASMPNYMDKWDEIIRKLDSKYNLYKATDNEKLKSYKDNITTIMLSKELGTISLSYIDDELMRLFIQAETDEL